MKVDEKPYTVIAYNVRPGMYVDGVGTIETVAFIPENRRVLLEPVGGPAQYFHEQDRMDAFPPEELRDAALEQMTPRDYQIALLKLNCMMNQGHVLEDDGFSAHFVCPLCGEDVHFPF